MYCVNHLLLSAADIVYLGQYSVFHELLRLVHHILDSVQLLYFGFVVNIAAVGLLSHRHDILSDLIQLSLHVTEHLVLLVDKLLHFS